MEASMEPNIYYSLRLDDKEIRGKKHRAIIGGLWDEIGQLMFDFLLEKGKLKPQHRVLDLGCGCFRCGIPLIKFLEPGNYYGLDLNEDLIKAGFWELENCSLSGRVPGENVIATGNFNARSFGVDFDIVFAQSVWTHLPLNSIERSLYEVDKVLAPDGLFLATFFGCPEDHDLLEPFHHSHNGFEFDTNRDIDPYHYRPSDFAYLIKRLGLNMEFSLIDDWGHPRNQSMLCFRFLGR